MRDHLTAARTAIRAGATDDALAALDRIERGLRALHKAISDKDHAERNIARLRGYARLTVGMKQDMDRHARTLIKAIRTIEEAKP